MISQICTNPEQSERLKKCGLDPSTADMVMIDGEEPNVRHSYTDMSAPYNEPAWSLTALLGMLPHCLNDKWWLDVAPVWNDPEWGIGWYNTDKPRTIKGLTHRADLVECCVQAIEWLTANGYQLNKTTPTL